MINKSEQNDFKTALDKVYVNNNFIFSNAEDFSNEMVIDQFNYTIVNFFGVDDEDIDNNQGFYEYYAGNSKVMTWLVQEEEEEVCDWIKKLNPQSNIIEVLDTNEHEIEEFKVALSWCMNSDCPKKRIHVK